MPPLVVVTPYGRDGDSSRVPVYDWLDHLGLAAEVHDYRGAAANGPRTLATGAVDAVRDGEAGPIVDADAPDQLADAVERLLDDSELRDRLAAARGWIVRDFRPGQVVASFVGHIVGAARA